MLAIIDIETTDLVPEGRQILEFACIAYDPVKDEVPGRFERVLLHKVLVGNPFALAMNGKIISEISQGIKDLERLGQYTARFCAPDHLERDFRRFLEPLFPDVRDEEKMTLTACGKNFASFDLNWLKPVFTKYVKFRHRVLDIGSLFYRPAVHGDTLPDLKTCLQMAGYDGTVAHRAMGDCEAVLNCLRYHYHGVRGPHGQDEARSG